MPLVATGHDVDGERCISVLLLIVDHHLKAKLRRREHRQVSLALDVVVDRFTCFGIDVKTLIALTKAIANMDHSRARVLVLTVVPGPVPVETAVIARVADVFEVVAVLAVFTCHRSDGGDHHCGNGEDRGEASHEDNALITWATDAGESSTCSDVSPIGMVIVK